MSALHSYRRTSRASPTGQASVSASSASTAASPRFSIGSWMPLAERSREQCGIAPATVIHGPARVLRGNVGGHGERQLGAGDGWAVGGRVRSPRMGRRRGPLLHELEAKLGPLPFMVRVLAARRLQLFTPASARGTGEGASPGLPLGPSDEYEGSGRRPCRPAAHG